MDSTPPSKQPYVSRSGAKLEAALDAFGIAPADWVCADLGCNVGGFTDCLLRRGARRVYAIDTGYGTLAYRLRTDPRVVVMERTNAMHVTLPEPVDLVTIDVGWTRQHHILPNAVRLAKPAGRIITLIKPHYEAAAEQLKKPQGQHRIPGLAQARRTRVTFMTAGRAHPLKYTQTATTTPTRAMLRSNSVRRCTGVDVASGVSDSPARTELNVKPATWSSLGERVSRLTPISTLTQTTNRKTAICMKFMSA